MNEANTNILSAMMLAIPSIDTTHMRAKTKERVQNVRPCYDREAIKRHREESKAKRQSRSIIDELIASQQASKSGAPQHAKPCVNPKKWRRRLKNQINQSPEPRANDAA